MDSLPNEAQSAPQSTAGEQARARGLCSGLLLAAPLHGSLLGHFGMGVADRARKVSSAQVESMPRRRLHLVFVNGLSQMPDVEHGDCQEKIPHDTVCVDH